MRLSLILGLLWLPILILLLCALIPNETQIAQCEVVLNEQFREMPEEKHFCVVRPAGSKAYPECYVTSLGQTYRATCHHSGAINLTPLPKK